MIHAIDRLVLLSLCSSVVSCGEATRGTPLNPGLTTLTTADDDGGDETLSTGLSEDETTQAESGPGTSDDAPGAESNDGPSWDVGHGDSGDDTDGDGIPDDDDPFPDDPEQPGVALGNTVYAHTAKRLHTMDVETYEIEPVGPFQWPADGGGHQMTDIAIDEHGVLYGITFDRAYVCNPTTAACFDFATLPTMFNGLTVVPVGTVLPDDEAIVGIGNDGDWFHLQLEGMAIQPVEVGGYGGAHKSSGDAFSIAGVGTYASTTTAAWQTDTDQIVRVDPSDGTIDGVVGSVTGYTRIWGLAGWHDQVFAFDETGAVLRIDPSDGTVSEIADTNQAWWGAGVRTVIPPPG